MYVMCTSRKYSYLPIEGIDFWKFQLSFILNLLALTDSPSPAHPHEIPILSVGEYGYFMELHNIAYRNNSYQPIAQFWHDMF